MGILIIKSSVQDEVLPEEGFMSQDWESGVLAPPWSKTNTVGVHSGAGIISGTYSARVRYAAGPVQEVSELYFDLTDDAPTGVSEMYQYFKIRVPSNIFHGDNFETNNNKFMKWGSHHDGGSSQGINLLWEFWNTNDATGDSELAFHWTVLEVDIDGHKQLTRVWGPAEAGTVQEFILYGKMSSASGEWDGIIRTWHKPAGAGSWTKIHEWLTAPLYPGPSWPTQTKWVGGYMMGASNSGYDEETDFFLDDIIFSETNLWGVS